MFKLMTYNILDGAPDRFDLVVSAVVAESPDFLVINEANGFEKNDNEKLKELSRATGLPHHALSLSGKGEYHVAVFSKFPFKESVKITPLMRAGILSVVDTDVGEVCVVGTHLMPYSEEGRAPEVALLTSILGKYPNKILTGDLNSLSPEDGYDEAMIKDFNEAQIKKFTEGGKLCFNTIQKLLDSGFTDLAVATHQNKVNTVPTASSVDTAHAAVRLDYVLASGPIVKMSAEYRVIKNDTTNKASDHFPIVVAFS